MHHRRRRLIGLLGGSLAATALPALGQAAKRMPRVGVLLTFPPASFSERLRAFEDGLRDHGYVDGTSIRLEYRSAEGRNDRLAALAADLVRSGVDLIVTSGQPAPDAALSATRTIPIVFAVSGDPVKERLVASLDRPGGNVTGLSSIGPDVLGKQLELFKEIVPKLSRVAVLHDPAHAGHPAMFQGGEPAARALGLKLVRVDAGDRASLERAFRRIAEERFEGALVLRGGAFLHFREHIARLAAENAIPTIAGHAEEAEAGLLFAYGTDVPDLYRRAATYVARILAGASPAELPVEQPTQFELVVNLKTAKALGLVVPQPVLLRASRVIE